MFVYNDKEYSSKAEVVRELYDLGKTSLAANHKKELAEKLGMSVQTVHATIMKHIGQAKSPKESTGKTVVPAVVQAKKKLETKTKSGKAIFINEEDDVDVKKELMKNERRIEVNFAPNQWGLPITNPPTYVIDPNYDPNWQPPVEDKIERPWEK